MVCKNCGQETHKIMMIEVDGFVVQVCPQCPRTEKKVEFPAVVVSGGSRTQDVLIRDDSKFNKYALTPAEIAETQALRPRTVLKDNPGSRGLDNVDYFVHGKRAKVYVGGDHPNRGKKVMDDLRRKLGGDVKVIADNGLKVVGERVG